MRPNSSFTSGLWQLIILFLVYSTIVTLISSCRSEPKRTYRPQIIQTVEPKQVISTWRFETIYSPKQIDQASLALDSSGKPNIAYGGDQLYYAWFDGITWHHEIPDPSPGAGKEALILFDAKDQPHIIYEVGGIIETALVHTFRNSTGWQRETIYQDFCNKRIADASYDSHGRLVVLFDGSPSCNESDITTTQLWYAQQETNGWVITQLVQGGINPALAFDPTGKPHVIYDNTTTGALDEAIWSGLRWETHQIAENTYYGGSNITFFGSDGIQYIVYTRRDVDINDNSVPIEYGWKDSFEWHFELIGRVSVGSSILSASMDSEKEVNLILWDSWKESLSKIQQVPSGWQQTDFSIDGQKVNNVDLTINRSGQFHVVHKNWRDQVLYYSFQQNAEWQSEEIDVGNQLDWHPSALAFDQNGNIATSFYSNDRSVRYFWDENGVWKNEIVGTGPQVSGSSSINLLFDPKNQPHIFYIDGKEGTQDRPLRGTHAFRVKNHWEAEELPETIGKFSEWSAPAISPEGWPVFIQKLSGPGRKDSLFFYRNESGWQSLRLNIVPVGIANPQIAYKQPPLAISTPPSAASLPGLVYTTGETREIAYFDPWGNKTAILPILKENQEALDYSLDFDPEGKPVVFATIAEAAPDNSFGPGQLFAVTEEKSGWKAYHIKTIQPGAMRHITIDNLSNAHLVYVVYETPTGGVIYYATGKGPDWKITRVNVEGLSPTHYSLIGSALRKETGNFCIEVVDIRANDLMLGCLESIE